MRIFGNLGILNLWSLVAFINWLKSVNESSSLSGSGVSMGFVLTITGDFFTIPSDFFEVVFFDLQQSLVNEMPE